MRESRLFEYPRSGTIAPEFTQTLSPQSAAPEVLLCDGYEPVAPKHLNVEQIVLAKGSQTTPERRRFVERICALYPAASRIESPDLPHNRVDLGESDPAALHDRGVRTLVFGVHQSAVRRSEESGNTCPNYYHFSVYGYCFYGCSYCYLAGTRGVWNSPTIKIYVNLPEIMSQIDRVATRLARPVAFYLGKLQDGLALDPLTAYSTVLVPFFASHPFARQVILTKSDAVHRLLELDHGGRTVLSWSLNPSNVALEFENKVPLVDARIAAMCKAAEAGYPVRAVLMPLIPVPDWEGKYEGFLRDLLSRVPLQRLTLGGICSYHNAQRLMERKLGRENTISNHLDTSRTATDGRTRYTPELRIKMYRHLLGVARRTRPDLGLALCLEEKTVWDAVNEEINLGCCNCIL